MELWAFIVTSIIFLKFILCAPITEDEINAECAKIRLEMKNVPPDKVEEDLLRKVAMERIAHEKTKKEKIDAEKDREKAEAESKRYIVPLTVRQYATYIEKRFSDVTGRVPDAVWQITPPEDRNRVKKKYRWAEIIDIGYTRADPYIRRIIGDLVSNFKRKYKIDQIQGEYEEKYRDYELEFCESIVHAIEFGNVMLAHAKSGRAVEALNVFDTVVDEYMTIFYNAMLESKIKKEIQDLR